jgi:hypothetical protein
MSNIRRLDLMTSLLVTDKKPRFELFKRFGALGIIFDPPRELLSIVPLIDDFIDDLRPGPFATYFMA